MLDVRSDNKNDGKDISSSADTENMFVLLSIVLVLFPADCLQLAHKDTEMEKFPYQAALIVDGSEFCSGALIHAKYVLTTAKCVYQAVEIDVVLGTANLNVMSNEVAMIATTFRIHENYDSATNKNDIALVQLPRTLSNAQLAVGNIATITLPNDRCAIPSLQFTVIGWSRKSPNPKNFNGLIGNKDVVLLQNCPRPSVPDSDGKVFCTKTSEVEDTGSPLVMKLAGQADEVLCGLASWNVEEVAVYVSVVEYKTWITLNII